MARFCVKCGATLSGPFCGKCGADTRNVAAPVPPQPPQPVAQMPPPQATPTPAVAAPAKQGMSTLAKLGIAAVVIIFVGGAAGIVGVYYVAHRVSQKIHQATDEILASSSDSSSSKSAASANSGGLGDPCRLLTKEEVSKAAGIEVIRADAKDSGCVYIAHGDPAEMTSRHLSAMTSSQVKALGGKVTPQQQQMMEQFTGAFFKQTEAADKDLSKEAATGDVPILSVSFSSGNAALEMKMTRMAFNHISQTDGKSTDQTATGDLSRIGDEAYEMGGTGLIMRKGNTVVHMMFPSCPCDANAMKPLLATIARRL